MYYQLIFKAQETLKVILVETVWYNNFDVELFFFIQEFFLAEHLEFADKRFFESEELWQSRKALKVIM